MDPKEIEARLKALEERQQATEDLEAIKQLQYGNSVICTINHVWLPIQVAHRLFRALSDSFEIFHYIVYVKEIGNKCYSG